MAELPPASHYIFKHVTLLPALKTITFSDAWLYCPHCKPLDIQEISIPAQSQNHFWGLRTSNW
jgi:hypothetical protein